MTLFKGRTFNEDTSAEISEAISLNSTTSTTILNAISSPNLERVYFCISNPSPNAIWIKFQAASVDNDQKGIWLPARSIFESTPDNLYIGEVSAISQNGTPEIYVTQF